MKLVVPGKWILVGEHAVVRGSPAIVAPLSSRTLVLEEISEEVSDHNPLQSALTKIADSLERVPESFPRLRVTSDIPLRAGLGSSAALSVAVAKYLEAHNFLGHSDVSAKARDFENIFHGTSSGLDLAAVTAEGPIFFRKDREPSPLTCAWQPKIYLHDSGTRSSTKECVEFVTKQDRADLDQLMMMAVDGARAALRLDEAEGISLLKDSILTAAKCFQEWGLINAESQRLEAALYDAGALAVKPTGSGNGGFLLSLWDKEPPKTFADLPGF